MRFALLAVVLLSFSSIANAQLRIGGSEQCHSGQTADQVCRANGYDAYAISSTACITYPSTYSAQLESCACTIQLPNGATGTCGCPDGEVPTETQENYYTCEPEEPPPPEDVCQEGEIQLFDNGESTCVFELPPPEPCSDIEGTVTVNGFDYTVCNDDKNACEANGGTYGAWGAGKDQNPVCLPPEYGQQLPTCEAGSVHTLEGVDINGFACTTVEPPEPPEPPGGECPDENNPNCPEYQPPVCENPPCDDPPGPPQCDDPNGCDGTEETGDDVRAAGGGTCDAPPSCTGDPVGCAILFQTWSARCAKDQDGSSVKGGGTCQSKPSSCKGDPINCAILLQAWHTRCDNKEEAPDAGEVTDAEKQSGLDAINEYFDEREANIGDLTGTPDYDQEVSDLQDTGSNLLNGLDTNCVDPTINFATGSMSIDCTKLNQFKNIMAWLLYVFTAYYLLQLAMRPVN